MLENRVCRASQGARRSPVANQWRSRCLSGGLLEGLGRGVCLHTHPLSPPKALSAFCTAPISALVTRPRASACLAPWRSRSGVRPATAQSLSVLRTEVTGTAPAHARSLGGTSVWYRTKPRGTRKRRRRQLRGSVRWIWAGRTSESPCSASAVPGWAWKWGRQAMQVVD